MELHKEENPERTSMVMIRLRIITRTFRVILQKLSEVGDQGGTDNLLRITLTHLLHQTSSKFQFNYYSHFFLVKDLFQFFLSNLIFRSGQSVDKPSRYSTNEASASVSDLEKDAVTAANQRSMSRLNYASPPFYPSSSSSKETTITHKREMQTETSNYSVQPSLLGERAASAQSTAIIRKDPNDSFGINKLNIDDSIPAVAGKPSSSLQLSPGLSSSMKSTHPQASRGQGRGFNASPHRNYQSPVRNNQVNSVSLPTQLHPAQRYSAQSRGQPFLQVTGQQLVQQTGAGSQVSSPPKTAQVMNTCEPGELAFTSESNKLTSSVVAKGKGSLQGPGRGYGAHIVGAPGNMGSGHSNQKFSGTPTFLPGSPFIACIIIY